MAKVTEENMYDDLDFTCKVCGQEATKVSVLEDEYGYISKVDNTWVGPLCNKCAQNSKPGYPIIKKSVPETMFVVVVQQDGEAIVVDYDDIVNEVKFYKRRASPREIINSCSNVVDNMKMARLLSLLQRK